MTATAQISAEAQVILRDIVRIPADQFDLQRTLVRLLNYAAGATGARSACLKRSNGDGSRATIVACSDEGGAIALEGMVESVNVPVFEGASPVGLIMLLRDASSTPLTTGQRQAMETIADLVALAQRRAQSDDEIRRSQLALREAVEIKYRLVGGLSMNLKNTLSVASGYLQLLDLNEELSYSQQDYIARGRRAIQTAVNLINEVVDLARAEAGDLSIELESISLGTFVRDAFANHAHAASAKRILLNADTPSHMPAVYTDPSYVRDILDALLSNALRYTPEGGCVTVRLEQREGRRLTDPACWVCMSVQDTGPGIPEPEVLFEEVRRVEKPKPPVGFRLVICRRIARLLGGDLTVESLPGRGASFTLWLPVPRSPI
ncbi:MAG: GAF domain-containing sensor histidine kinase [Longimicrobiales bacterium]